MLEWAARIARLTGGSGKYSNGGPSTAGVSRRDFF